MEQVELRIATRHHQDMVAITGEVARAITELGLRDGLVHCYTRHTTCGLTINENADPDVVHDLLGRLERLIPWHEASDRHAEGNSAAHLRASFMGSSVSLPVRDGQMQLGTWQGIFLCEFDGPRERRVLVSALPA